MIAGVGKSYRCYQMPTNYWKAVSMSRSQKHTWASRDGGIGGRITHHPRRGRKIFYSEKRSKRWISQSILSIHPEVVIADELAHTNVEGSKNESVGRMSWIYWTPVVSV